MRKKGLYGLLAAGLLVLSSCLGDPATQFTISNACGVVVYQIGYPEQLIYVKGGQVISSDDFQNIATDDGECILFDYAIDYGLPENKDDGAEYGFMTATIYPATIVEVQQHELIPSLTDTTLVDANELLLSTLQSRHAFIYNKLFLFTEIKNHSANQTDSFSLSYNPNQVLGSDEVYELYLRTIVTEPDTAVSSKTMIVPCAFNLNELVKKAGGTDTESAEFKVRINYVKGFNKDTTACVWGTYDVYTLYSKTDVGY